MPSASLPPSVLSRRGTAFFYVVFCIILFYIVVRMMISGEVRQFGSGFEPLGWVALAACGFALLYLSANLLTRRIHRVLPTLIVVGTATVLPRIAWVLIAPTKPRSDFDLYYRYAVDVAQGNLENYHATFSLFPFKTGFGLFLGTYLHFFGASEISAKMFNILVSLSTALIIWWIAYMLGGRFAANLAALAYAGYITQILFTSVIASEHLGTVLMLAGFAILIRAYQLHELAGPNGTRDRARGLLLAAGFVIGISGLVRPLAVLVILISLLYVIFGLGEWRSQRRVVIDKALSFGFPLAGMGLSIVLVSMPLSTAVGMPLHQSSSWFSIMMGTNPASGGQYSREDAAIVKDLNYDFETVHHASKLISQRHLDDLGWGFFEFAERKTVHMWANDNYGSLWSLPSTSPASAEASTFSGLEQIEFLEQSYYMMLLLTFLVSGFSLFRSRAKLPLIPTLFFLGSFAGYLLLEVQPRYHYPVVVFLITMAGLWATPRSMHPEVLINGDESRNLAEGNELDLRELAVSQASASDS